MTFPRFFSLLFLSASSALFVVVSLITFTTFVANPSCVSAQTSEYRHASALFLALKKLNTLGSVLYVAAHPDDENTAFIAYAANERLWRATYLSITRGDGGQNIIGSEQSELLGIIRTQELLAARRKDGGEQFFTRALDFGYSKTPEETMNIWGKERVLADVVWAIRVLRPDVIVTRFPVTGEGGHGHHTASAILAEEAFAAAGDPNRFPEHLRFVKVWQPKRVVWNAWLPILEARKGDISTYPALDLSVYSPLLGKSMTEIAAESRSMHKSQGFGASAARGELINYFELRAGDAPSGGDIFSGIDATWNRVKGGAEIGKILDEAAKKFQPENPTAILPLLVKAYKAMNALEKSSGDDYWIPLKRRELVNVIRLCAGVWTEAIAQNQPQQGETGYSGVPGGLVRIAASIVNRSNAQITLKRVLFPFAGDSLVNKPLERGKYQTVVVTKTIPLSTPISQPYWLESPPEQGAFVVADQNMIGAPENPPALVASFVVVIAGEEFALEEPVLHRRTDRVLGETYRPFVVAPPVAVNFSRKSFIFPDTAQKEISVLVVANEARISGKVRLSLPDGWSATPESIAFDLPKKGDEMRAVFRIKPPLVSVRAEEFVRAEATLEGANPITVDKSMTTIQYNHIPAQVVFSPARARLLRVETRKSIASVGYIAGASDEVGEYLAQCGFRVQYLSDEEIEEGDLSRFDAIVTGVRVYNDNARPRLRQQQERLLQYVQNGGTMIAQYQLANNLATDSLGPYPFTISRERVTEENAAVNILLPEHLVLRFPNVITSRDFEGWVQERGLYFASRWDKRYEALFSCNDAGETEKKGGLLLARHGKGVFIYTGFSWFRQLPAGVPGAYRIFVNLLHASQTLRADQTK